MIFARPIAPRSTVHGRLAPSVIAVALIYAAIAWAGLAFTQNSDHIPLLWLPSAFLIAVLLRSPRDHHIYYVFACILAHGAASVLLRETPTVICVISLVAAIEARVVARLLIDREGERPDIAKLSTLCWFSLFCVIVPAIIGVFETVALSKSDGFDGRIWSAWFTADALGMMIGTPLVVIAIDAWSHRHRPTRRELIEWTRLGLGVTVTTSAIFAQTRYPFLFLASPIVVVAAFRTGVSGTAVAVALISAVAAIATSLGHGPIMLVRGDLGDKLIALQTFLATNFIIGLPVAVAIRDLNTIRRNLTESRDLNKSILDNVDEVIFKADRQGRWVYLNPAWERITGYTVAESLGWSTVKLLHRDDMIETASSYPKLMSGEIAETVLRQRFFRKDGECRHIEVTVRRLSDPDGAFSGSIGNIRDVSDRVAQIHALAESEERFRRMAEASPIGIFRGHPQNGITYVNRAFAEKLGMPPEDAMGDGWRQGLLDDSPFDGDPAFQGFTPDNPIRKRLLNFRGSGDGDIWIESVNNAEFDEDGNVVGFIGAMVDITDQRRATQRLIESERRFQALANLAPAGIFRTDAAGNCTYVNNAWLRITGLKDGEWQDGGWANALHPDDVEAVTIGWALAVEHREDYRAEFRWLHPDGSECWVDVLGRPETDEAGNTIGFIGVTMDISDRRRIEDDLAERDRQLMLLAANATDAVFRLALDGRCLYASPSARDLMGIDPVKLVGENMLSGFHPDDEARVRETFASIAGGEADGPIVAYRSRSLVTDEYRWLEANCGSVRDTVTGRIQEVIASIRDVSETMAMQDELRDARIRAEQGAAAKSAFLANMSHEIRTPMNGVIGFTELLLAEDLTADQHRHVMLIAESGRAMMRLLNDILDMSKIEAGQMRIANEPVDIRTLIRSAARLMEPVAQAKNVDLTIQVDPAVPSMIESDQLRLRQIILNLIGNATKFTETGWIEVQASVEGADDAHQLRIDVRDTGVGIAADKIDAVFQQFAQADSTIARRFGGTGLGLPISAELAQLMGGTIGVKSELGKGTIFTLHVPMVAVAPDLETPAVTKDHAAPSATATARLRVLVAEDHDINQVLITAMATRAGMDPEIANNGAEAIDMVTSAAAEGSPYALVLMDMQMPEIDGLEATRRLRAAGFDAATLPIVALTANAYAEDIAACLDAGMQAHLSKPVRLRDLQDVVARHAAPADAAGDREDATIVVAESASAGRNSLADRFAARKTELLELIARVIREGHLEDRQFATLTTLLHQFAGTAGFFGQSEQGSAAAALEQDLKAAGRYAAPAMLTERWEALDVAA